VLYYRIAKLGGGRMPRVGSQQVDERGIRMIHDWIARMPAPNPGPAAAGTTRVAPEDLSAIESLRQDNRLSPANRSAAIGRLASSTRGALTLLALIDQGQNSESLKREVVSITKNSPLVEVRDLFERFIPEQERTKRLGDVINRAAILTLPGDSARGLAVFTTNSAAQCKSCHKAGDIGETVGPDLTKIGSKYDKAALLDQILEPSKTIDPAYVTHLVETKDGKIISGLLVQKTNDAVVLKDAQGKINRIAAAEIDQFAPQSRSLMPELLLRDMTAQQVADLLEFLASLR
jgi:putative heme-binding domain-containing protein